MKVSFNSTFDSISPSAKSLMLTKALTTIPFAKEAIELIWSGNLPQFAQERLSSIDFILRLIHFETRYWSIDEALSEIGIKNILEFSSGYSFRGLSLCKNPEISYIDTDLPQLMEGKKRLVRELIRRYCTYSLDNLILQELNVLDEESFIEILHLFPPGPIALVNEGLLVYLDEEQKRKLCTIIHKILSDRGGYWITADIYRKKDEHSAITIDIFDEQGMEFLAKHHVEDNKFESFESAENFFRNCGFEIYKKIEVPPAQVSSRKLLGKIPRSKLEDLKSRKKTRETWILEVNIKKKKVN
jgi:O-methyltransferase involved in polyketide biosynthesis